MVPQDQLTVTHPPTDHLTGQIIELQEVWLCCNRLCPPLSHLSAEPGGEMWEPRLVRLKNTELMCSRTKLSGRWVIVYSD